MAKVSHDSWCIKKPMLLPCHESCPVPGLPVPAPIALSPQLVPTTPLQDREPSLQPLSGEDTGGALQWLLPTVQT